MTEKYSDKLKDPRWQKKRLEILERDEWQCQSCYDSEHTLHVHHRRYIPDRDPWDYPNQLLITLCESCHELEMEMLKERSDSLIEQVQEKFFSDGIESLAAGFNALEIVTHDSHVVADAYGWALSNPDIQVEMVKRYFEHLKRTIHEDDKPMKKDN